MRSRLRGSTREPAEGIFLVTAVAPVGREGREYRARVSGVLSGSGVAATAVTTWVRGLRRRDQLPSVGQEFPALIDRDHPARFEVRWPGAPDATTEQVQDEAYARQVAAAMRLGLDASVVPAASPPSARLRGMVRGMLDERVGNGPLPDGSAPVSSAEAAQILEFGEAAMATVTGIDFLAVPAAVLPAPEASLANVALEVRRGDGTAYRALARFGFRTAARRAQVGFVGASVPVRISADDHSRVALDARALPPASDPG